MPNTIMTKPINIYNVVSRAIALGLTERWQDMDWHLSFEI